MEFFLQILSRGKLGHVFGSMDTRTATERLIVLTETRSKDAAEREKLRTGINTLATDLVGLRAQPALCLCALALNCDALR